MELLENLGHHETCSVNTKKDVGKGFQWKHHLRGCPGFTRTCDAGRRGVTTGSSRNRRLLFWHSKSDPVLTITTRDVKSKGQQDVSKKGEVHLIRTPYAPLKEEEQGPFAETSNLLYDVIHSCHSGNSSETKLPLAYTCVTAGRWRTFGGLLVHGEVPTGGAVPAVQRTPDNVVTALKPLGFTRAGVGSSTRLSSLKERSLHLSRWLAPKTLNRDWHCLSTIVKLSYVVYSVLSLPPCPFKATLLPRGPGAGTAAARQLFLPPL